VFPAPHGHGGFQTDRLSPHYVGSGSGAILEFPITVAPVMGRRLCFFGGGYLRLYPWPLIRRMSRLVFQEDRPVVFYVHPREIDPDHPRLPMNLKRRFKTYVNLGTTERKIRKILKEFPVTTFERFIVDHPLHLEA